MEQQKKKNRKPRRRDAGMTLLEILIVLALITTIASSIGVMVFNNYKRGLVKVAKTQVGEVVGAVQQFMMDNNNDCPTGVEDLISGSYLKQNYKDPWNSDFIVRCPGEQDPDADVVSIGPDKSEGTDDDINSWEI